MDKNLSGAINFCLQYHKINSRPNTITNYKFHLGKFGKAYNDKEIDTIKTEEIISFLADLSEGRKQNTKRSRYTTQSAFFNLIANTLLLEMQNPCLPLQQRIYSANLNPIYGLSLIKTSLIKQFLEH